LEELPSLPAVIAGTAVLMWFGGYQAWVLMVVVIGVILYAFEIALFPWVTCPPQRFLWGGCGGSGKQWSPKKNAWRTCRNCGGLGKVVRLGRRLWTWSTDVNENRK
jgi:hypothetical protein